MYIKLLGCASIMLVLGALASAQTPVPGVAAAEEQPAAVTICQLKSDPAAYNHKLVEVTGFVSHAFEDFTVFDPTCPSWPKERKRQSVLFEPNLRYLSTVVTSNEAGKQHCHPTLCQ